MALGAQQGVLGCGRRPVLLPENSTTEQSQRERQRVCCDRQQAGSGAARRARHNTAGSVRTAKGGQLPIAAPSLEPSRIPSPRKERGAAALATSHSHPPARDQHNVVPEQALLLAPADVTLAARPGAGPELQRELGVSVGEWHLQQEKRQAQGQGSRPRAQGIRNRSSGASQGRWGAGQGRPGDQGRGGQGRAAWGVLTHPGLGMQQQGRQAGRH